VKTPLAFRWTVLGAKAVPVPPAVVVAGVGEVGSDELHATSPRSTTPRTFRMGES
jgi:hypothetical protein